MAVVMGLTQAERTVVLTPDALDALRRIAALRREPVGSDAEVRQRREDVRSYAVDVVNAIFRAMGEP